MRRWVALPLLLAAVAVWGASSGTAAPARSRPIVQTKTQAEVNVLRVVARTWKRWRKYGVIDRRTHLLADNTRAICRGRKKRHRWSRYHRFVCIVRPPGSRSRLSVLYRAFANGRSTVALLAYRRR